tara:strand:+ start:6308 stop:7819 length:1512 start_codon:yes stop_codon:yes gene_type:complete
MPAAEIKALRQAGNLGEALAMAQEELNASPENIWCKRNISWVYYAYLKKSTQETNFEGFIENLNKLKELNLPEEEVMIFDTSAYQVGSMLFKIQNSEPVDYSRVNQMFDIIRNFHFTKPSEGYSFMYKAFHKGYKNWSKYLQFADWWNFENFMPADYLKEKVNEKKIMAVAEQGYIAYSKKLLQGEPIDSFAQKIKVDKEKIETFLPFLDEVLEKHPTYQYPPYFKAKLLLALGRDNDTLSAFLPFANQKKNDYWVWELMAEIFIEDKEVQFACYCKALSLRTPEDFLVKLRQTFAAMLVDRQMYQEAKTEIEKAISTRSKHEWKLPNQITNWVEQDWYKSAIAKSDNSELYSKYFKKADEILFQYVSEEIVGVEFVNESKNILNFVKNKKKFGFFKYSNHLIKPQIGDILNVRFNGEGQEGFFKILTVKKADSNSTTEAFKKFEGTLRVISPQGFGFVEDVFIDSKFIQDKNLTNGQTYMGKAILSFNKKKDEWGWKAIAID